VTLGICLQRSETVSEAEKGKRGSENNSKRKGPFPKKFLLHLEAGKGRSA